MSKVELFTERLRVFLPDATKAPAMLRYVTENRDHLTPWSPPLPEAYYTLEYWQERMAAWPAQLDADRALRLVLEPAEGPGRIIGTCNFSQIFRGAFEACYLGYAIDHRYQGRGLMQEALEAAIAYVFDTLQLHRIMANYMPTNERSGAVLRRLGFTEEGRAADYLFINGAWRDHVLTSLTNPSGKPPRDP